MDLYPGPLGSKAQFLSEVVWSFSCVGEQADLGIDFYLYFLVLEMTQSVSEGAPNWNSGGLVTR